MDIVANALFGGKSQKSTTNINRDDISLADTNQNSNTLQANNKSNNPFASLKHQARLLLNRKRAENAGDFDEIFDLFASNELESLKERLVRELELIYDYYENTKKFKLSKAFNEKNIQRLVDLTYDDEHDTRRMAVGLLTIYARSLHENQINEFVKFCNNFANLKQESGVKPMFVYENEYFLICHPS